MRRKKNMMICFGMVLVLMTIGTASAGTFTVDDSGGHDYITIQAAINNATDGDTILVYPGTYTENVYVDKEITVISQSGNPGDTIVQVADLNHPIFYVTADNVTIRALNVTGLNNYVGISLYGVEGCTIAENGLSNTFIGIKLEQSINNMLSNNTANSNSDTGIGLLNSSDNTLNNNTANSNGDCGIWLSRSRNNILNSNIVSNNYYGIRLELSSNNNMLSDNSASSNTESGIYLYSSSNNLLNNNTANSNSDTGIGLLNSSDNMLNDNTASSNTDCGIWLSGSINNTLSSNNENLNNHFGIRLEQFSNNNLLNNNTASSNTDSGIYLYSSSNNSLNNNAANSNSDTGIGLLNSSDNMLSNNTASSNTDSGIWLSESSNNTLSSNNANLDNYFGIRLEYSSNSNMLSNNIVSNNFVGIRLEQSCNNKLNNNTANSNSDTGIGLLNSSDNTLSSNIVSNDSDDGIYLDNSSNNLLYNNYFNNTNNVEYNGTNTVNVWNITMTVGTNIVGGHLLGGNYWTHPDGTGFSVDTADSNKDGICDEQFNLSETEFDYLPLIIVDDNLMPLISITSPADGSSTTASSIAVSGLVNGTGSLPVVTVNDIVAETTILNFSGTFTATVPLVIGANTIYANVTDAAGNTNTTSVKVTRTSSSSGGNGGGGSSGGGSGATGEAFENIAFKDVKTEDIIGGLVISYTFDEEQNAIQYINFSALRNYGRVSTTIEVLKNISAMVDESAPGVVYSNLNIWVGRAGFATEDNIADPVIGFSVAKAWMTENGIDENSIALYRHSESKWNALNTMKVGEDDSYLYFEAKTPGFSPFAIVGVANEDESVSIQDSTLPSDGEMSEVGNEDTQTESKGIPWISTGSLVLIVVGVHLLMRKRI